MTSSIPGSRDLPSSRYDLGTYWGRVRHSMGIADPSTLLVSSQGLEDAKQLVARYKQGEIKDMTPGLWRAKQIIDSTLHPDTGQPVFLPFRMSCFIISNLVVTAGMLNPNMGTAGTLAWQVANQSLNVGINYSNANKTSPLSTQTLLTSYALAVSASCGVAYGLNALIPRLKRASPALRTTLGRLIPFAAVASAGVLNVGLMRGEEMRVGIDVYPISYSSARSASGAAAAADNSTQHKTSAATVAPVRGEADEQSLGKSRVAARLAVGETALSRVLNATPVMILPSLLLMRLQQQAWLAARPRLVLPVNLGLILLTSIFALPPALAVFPQRQRIAISSLEPDLQQRYAAYRLAHPDARPPDPAPDEAEFNRGI